MSDAFKCNKPFDGFWCDIRAYWDYAFKLKILGNYTSVLDINTVVFQTSVIEKMFFGVHAEFQCYYFDGDYSLMCYHNNIFEQVSRDDDKWDEASKFYKAMTGIDVFKSSIKRSDNYIFMFRR